MNTSLRERMVVGSIIEEPEAPFGPCVSTALAYAPYSWDSAEARPIAVAIRRCVSKGQLPTQCRVDDLLSVEERAFLANLMLDTQNRLPMSCLEAEALELCKVYRIRAVIRCLGEAWAAAKNKPDQAMNIAATTQQRLRELTHK